VTTLEPLKSGELVIEPGSPGHGGALTLVWKGRSTDRNPSQAILPFATLWLERALHQSVPLCLEFEPLDYMNSSTISAIIQIIQTARTQGVSLVIRYDAAKPWQRLGFEALRVFASNGAKLELVAVEGKASS
jgi:hypothetical protein